MSKTQHSWLRQPEEPENAYKAFSCYLVHRNMIRAYRLYVESTESAKNEQKSIDYVSNSFRSWAKKYDWEQRCTDYDNHLATISLKETEKHIVSNKERYAKLATLVLDKLEEDAKSGVIDPKTKLELLKYLDAPTQMNQRLEYLQRLTELSLDDDDAAHERLPWEKD